MSKVCSKCGIEKDNTSFNLRSSTSSKLRSWCKLCERVADKNRPTYLPNPTITHKKCSTCQEIQEITCFNKRPISKDGYTGVCKSCRTANLKWWDSTKEMKTKKHCSSCDQIKDVAKFHINHRMIDGFQSRCKQCVSDYQKKNRKRFTKRKRNSNLLRNYGIDENQYNFMLWAQENKCLICDKEFGPDRKDWPHVDHCHETEEVRGLLCTKCNVGIGMFLDDVDRLQRAIQYLAYSTGQPLLEETV